MKESKSILIQFDSRRKLLQGIDTLNHYKVPISEVYIPEFIPVLAQKLRARELKRGAFMLRFGWFAGAVAIHFLYYLFQGGVAGDFNAVSYQGPVLSLTITVVILMFAAFLFPSRVSKVRRLGAGDKRYLLVIKCNSVIQQKQLIHLLKYSPDVFRAGDIKNMIIRREYPNNKYFKSI